MRTYTLLIATLFAGCSSNNHLFKGNASIAPEQKPTPVLVAFTPDEARLFAMALVIDKYEWLVGVTAKIGRISEARFDNGQWKWHCLRGSGLGDQRINVTFGPHGESPMVEQTYEYEGPLL